MVRGGVVQSSPTSGAIGEWRWVCLGWFRVRGCKFGLSCLQKLVFWNWFSEMVSRKWNPKLVEWCEIFLTKKKTFFI